MSDIVERLLTRASGEDAFSAAAIKMRHAAAEITSLRAKLDVAREALFINTYVSDEARFMPNCDTLRLIARNALKAIGENP
jgi:hypothetical protein